MGTCMYIADKDILYIYLLFARWNLHEIIIYGLKLKNGYHLFVFLSCMLVI